MNQNKTYSIFQPVKLILLITLTSILFIPVHRSYALFSPNKTRTKSLNNNLGEISLKKLSPQELQSNEILRPLLSKYGQDWSIFWNTQINSLSRAINRNPALESTEKVLNQREVLQKAQNFLIENEILLKVNATDFLVKKISEKGNTWYIKFQQQKDNVPIYGANFTIRYNQYGKLLIFGGEIYPEITLNTAYTLNETEATNLAVDNLNLPDEEPLRIETPRLIIFPNLELDNEETPYLLCWEIAIYSTSQAKGWKYIIDAHNKVIRKILDLNRYMVSGNIQGKILPKYFNDTPITTSFPYLNISLLNKEAPVMFENLNANPGWNGTSPLYSWEFGPPNSIASNFGGPTYAHTGDNIFGYNLSGPYQDNIVNPEYLSTSMIDCTQGNNLVLRFWRWLGVEGSADYASINIKDSSSWSWYEMWSNPKNLINDQEWKLVYYDISSYADGKENLSISWGMGPTDSSYNLCGWNLDDIGIYNSVRAVTDLNGNFQMNDEATNNILDVSLNGSYFQVISAKYASLIYTKNNVGSNSTGINITLTTSSNFDQISETGLINSSGGIDELNAYYHANNMLKHLSGIDGNFLKNHQSFFPIKMTVQNEAELNNSYWLLGDGIYFGLGDGTEFRDCAQFSDIIYHELGHAITDAIYDSQNGSNSRFNSFDAMHETFSDYWACTINNDSQIAEGGFWINHSALRNLNNNLDYQTNYGEELYDSSLILSGAMWELRQALRGKYGDAGIQIADKLFLFAMYAEPTSYFNFLLDVIAVDNDRNNGNNEDLIREVFGSKGIAEPPTSPIEIMVTSENSIITLNWGPVSGATGYNLYYNISAIRTVNRYTTGETGENDGGSGGNDDGGSMDDNSQGSDNNTSGGGGSSENNYENKIDVGDTTFYQLDNLQNNTEYRLLLTSYNEYGVESSPSQQIYAIPQDPNATDSTIQYILVPTESSSNDDKSSTCFIKNIRSFLRLFK